MDQLTKLNRTLTVASRLLDNAAHEIRDATLSPTKVHIHSIGTALASIFEIQNAIYKLRPELEPQYDEEPEETRSANRRLGEALIAAYDLADSGRIPEAVDLLARFATTDPSEYHRNLAEIERERLANNYGA